MKKIKLTQNKYALVDDNLFDCLSRWKWCFAHGYAARRDGLKIVYMHRIINSTSDNLETDHINMNKLDNRRENLRTADRVLNGRNRGVNKNNTSGHRGISWKKRDKRWAVNIKVKYKYINLGCFKNLWEAIGARKKGEELYWI